MKHKHARQMMEYAKDAQETDKPWERWEGSHFPGGKWYKCTSSGSMWVDGIEYRRIDPYLELREAYDMGEVIQWFADDCWQDLNFKPMFDKSPDSYRIKPKTKTLYKWALKDANGWFEAQEYYETKEELLKTYSHFDSPEYKRLDYTAIEVDE